MTLATDRQAKSVQLYSEFDFDTLLDVGCGDGELTVALAEACGATEVYGLDISEEGVRRARERGVNATALDLDTEEFPFESGYFDSVYSGEVLDYVDRPDNYFREIHRCLADDGVFVLSTPNLSSLHNRLALLAGKLPYPMRSSTDILADETEQVSRLSDRRSVYTLDALYRTLDNHGFDVVETIGARSYNPDGFSVTKLFEDVVTRYPSLSYRNILVCTRADRIEGPADDERTQFVTP